GRAKALDMILFSRRIGAAEALKIGLVDRISTPEKLMEDAIAFATELTERPPLALQWVLKSMAAGMYEGLDSGLDVEAEGSAAMRSTKDREEGFKAFLEKRKPVWRGE
ncbi:enoyl-CoA hydratase/isomerase family protein, partial [Thermodesulfobacteriota bacterium]